MTFTEIKKEISARGIKHRDFADELGISPQQFSNWMTGRIIPSALAVLAMELTLDKKFRIHAKD